MLLSYFTDLKIYKGSAEKFTSGILRPDTVGELLDLDQATPQQVKRGLR
jgi:hypothetical protein